MANRYWTGGTGTWDASDTTHWSDSSGGLGGQSVPGVADSVIFDASSGGGTVTPNYDMSVVSITMGAFTGTLDFSANDNSPTLQFVNISGTGTRTLNMGDGTWTLTLEGNVWFATTITNLTLNANSSTIKFTSTGTDTSLSSADGLTYHNVWFARGAATSKNAIVGANTFNELKDTGTAAHKLMFPVGQTQTISTFTVSGTAGNLITITGQTSTFTDSTDTYTLSKASGSVQSQYLVVQHSIATGGATWDAGTSSTDNQGVATTGSGWTFLTSPNPGVPTSLNATSGVQQIDLTWVAPANEGFSPITNYKVYRDTASPATTLIDTLGVVLTYNDPGLTNGTEYFYRVKATNAEGDSGYSNEDSATPQGVPTVPLNLTATGGSDDTDPTIELDWDAPTSAEGSPITAYKIYRDTTSPATTLLTTIGNITSYSDDSIENKTEYFYRVKAVNAIGDSGYSNEDNDEVSFVYTYLAKPTGTPYTNVNFQGKEQYDQSNILFDDPLIFYDGVDIDAWINLAKPTGGAVIRVGMATGLIMPPTYAREYNVGSPWTNISKPTT